MHDTPSRPPHRPIRSFVRREGRLTVGQQRALDELFPRFGLPGDTPLDLSAVFGRSAPVTLEIGFGNGETLAAMAAAAPERDFIGIEVHRPGVGHLLQRIEALGLTNLRVICADAVEVLEHALADASLDTVQLFFPDPWHKSRHHKRRIVQPAFVARIARKLAPGGLFHLATDWENYAEHMREVMEAAEEFRNATAPGAYAPRPSWRPLSKFEQRGLRLGHGVWDLLYRRV
ncbi:MAG: tRNA (guanosine(46)-N7)-methyltransferase TrmB [Halothiobacillaceae bacterium]|jgi:tRNA (guanine-N7-)-methyltransferase|nr:tRNA (guanosine(46)-N7)-methyltransferase TrmB [Halothiobacillaceae bacterium]